MKIIGREKLPRGVAAPGAGVAAGVGGALVAAGGGGGGRSVKDGISAGSGGGGAGGGGTAVPPRLGMTGVALGLAGVV